MSGPDAQSSSLAVLAEKPSVARDIARVLGATKQGQRIPARQWILPDVP
jgi:DNA topoisomerase IA